MTYLQRIDYRPSMANLQPDEERFLQEVVQVYGSEVVVYGEPVRWEHIDEVEVVVAPHAAGPAGWIVKRLLLRNETRYHLGIYYGSQEVVLPNITLNTARHVLQEIAYYAPQQVLYKGPENLVPLTEI